MVGMYKRLKLYTLALLLCGTASSAIGQTVAPAGKDTAKATAPSSFNALDYSLQKRYRPKGDTFGNKRFRDNTYVSLSTGYERFYLRDYDKYNSGPVFGLAFGKAVSRCNAFRLAAMGNVMTGKSYEDSKKMVIAGIQGEHLFNFSSYVAGYDPSRFFEVSSVEGLGYHLSVLDGECTHAADVHLGVQLKLHPASRVDITLEPRVTLYSSNIDHSENSNWHKYNMGYGVWVGVCYRLSSPEGEDGRGGRSLQEAGPADNLFGSVTAGGALPASRVRLGLKKAVGMQYSLAVGKWFMPVFGLRLSGFMASDGWGTDYVNPRVTYSNRMIGGRLEAMVNLLALFNSKMFDSAWELNVLPGVEVASLRKDLDTTPNELKTVYAGFTGGMQVKYKFLKHFGLFVEPRFSQVPYKLDRLRDDGVSRRSVSYTDRQLSLNAGLQYTF